MDIYRILCKKNKYNDSNSWTLDIAGSHIDSDNRSNELYNIPWRNNNPHLATIFAFQSLFPFAISVNSIELF